MLLEKKRGKERKKVKVKTSYLLGAKLMLSKLNKNQKFERDYFE